MEQKHLLTAQEEIINYLDILGYKLSSSEYYL